MSAAETKGGSKHGDKRDHTRVRELYDEEIHSSETRTGRKKEVRNSYSFNVGLPEFLTQPWDHVVNAEREYILAVLSLFGLDEDRLDDMMRASKRSRPRQTEEKIEIREIRVD